MSKLFSLNSNTIFSNLTDEEKLRLFDYLQNYNIAYRDVLNLHPDLTLGIEIEFSGYYEFLRERYLDIFNEWFLDFFHTTGEYVYDYYLNNGWTIKSEACVAAEFSSPIFYDITDTYKQIADVYYLLNSHKARMNQFCSLHVNIGTLAFNHDIQRFIRFLKIYGAFEDVILSFCRETKSSLRYAFKIFSKPLAYKMHDILLLPEDVLEQRIINDYPNFVCDITNACLNPYFYDKTSSMSLVNASLLSDNMTNNRIEFRAPNGTLNVVHVQNTINFFAKLISGSYRKDFPFEDYYDQGDYNYQDCDLDKALLLCDLVFDNNLDKLNFLKQLYTYQEVYQQQKIKHHH